MKTSGTANTPNQICAAIQCRAVPSGRPKNERLVRNNLLLTNNENSNKQIRPAAKPNANPGSEPPPGSRSAPCHVHQYQAEAATVRIAVAASQPRCNGPKFSALKSTCPP